MSRQRQVTTGMFTAATELRLCCDESSSVQWAKDSTQMVTADRNSLRNTRPTAPPVDPRDLILQPDSTRKIHNSKQNPSFFAPPLGIDLSQYRVRPTAILELLKPRIQDEVMMLKMLNQVVDTCIHCHGRLVQRTVKV